MLPDSNAHFGKKDKSASIEIHLCIMIVIIRDGHSMANKIKFPVHELKEGGEGKQSILHSLSDKTICKV